MKTVLLCWLLVAGAVLACEVPVFRLLLDDMGLSGGGGTRETDNRND